MSFVYSHVMVHVDVLVGALNVLVGLLLIQDIALAPMYINWKCDCGGVFTVQISTQ